MDGPEADRLMEEWLHLHGTPEQRAAFRSISDKRRRMLDDHERRLMALETAISSVQTDLKDIVSEARTTRAEQNMMLKEIVGQVQTIVREQDRELGRRQGTAEVNAQLEKTNANRRSWAQAVLPFLVGAAVTVASLAGIAATQFIREVAADVEQP